MRQSGTNGLKEYPLKVEFGRTITLNKDKSPCSMSFDPGTRIFIESFDMRSDSGPDNFVLLSGDQINFHSSVFLRERVQGSWKDIQLENGAKLPLDALITRQIIIFF